jgi:ankyrin repeat protein
MVTRSFLSLLVALTVAPGIATAATGQPLIDAVKSDDITAVRALLPQANVNIAQDDGTTALYWAVYRDNVSMADLLVKAGAKVEVANRYKMTPLALAAAKGNATMIEHLLKAGANVDGTTVNGETALMTASRIDRTDAVKMLIAHGANVNARETFHGQTALMWASARGNVAVVKTLIEAGADVNAKSTLILRKHSNDTVDFTKTPTVGGQSGWNWSTPEASAFSPLLFAVRQDQADVVRVLLDRGANVNDTVSDGTSALVLAVTNAHYDLAGYLLDRGADPNANGQGWTALHQVVRQRRWNARGITPPVPTGTMDTIDLIKKLLDKGAHVNARMWNNLMMTKDGQRQRFNYMGTTPFEVAAKIGDLPVMKLLLASGADPHIPNVENENALMVAAGVGLFSPGEDAGSDPEHMAERLEAIKICVSLGVDVNAVTTPDHETALHGAAYLGDTKVVQYLIDQGAKLDVKNDRGWTPLMIAKGVSYAEFYKEQPEVSVLLTRLMTERGLPTDGMGDQKTCKDCILTRPEEAYRRTMRDRAFQANEALVSELRNAK